MKELYGKCGNNCGHCSLYVENLTDDRRQWCVEGLAKYLNWNPKPETLRPCAGCQSSGGYLYLRNCAVRACARHNGAETCAQCTVFPCQDVPTVSHPVDYRDKLSERLGRPIPEEDYYSFVEPYEGMAHLEAIRTRLCASQLVPPAPVQPLKTRIVAFPGDLSMNGDQTAGFKTLHKLMACLLCGHSELYVRQVLMRKRRHTILNILWAFGRHGQFEEANGGQIVMHSADHGAPGVFANIVRKRDNALHGGAALSAGLLADFGLDMQHTALSRRDWQLTLSLEEEAGGKESMKALQRYTASLVAQYGEPVYRGSSRFKGDAYSRFSQADMRGLQVAQGLEGV